MAPGTRPKNAEIRFAAREAMESTQRRLIADAACRVVNAEGLENASLRRIAEELGCTTGLIAHYFQNKEDLLVAALQTAMHRLKAAVTRRHASVETLNEHLDAFLEVLPFEAEQRLCWRVFIAYRGAAVSSPRLMDECRRFLADMKTTWRNAVALELDADPDSHETGIVTDALDAMLHGIGTAAALDPETYPPVRVKEMIKGAVAGLLVQARRKLKSR